MDAGIERVNARVKEEGRFVADLQAGMAQVIVGQKYLIDRLIIGLLANGHVLLEGVPGLAKTLSVRTLAALIDASFQRIQFTPDLLPADLIGTLVYNPREATFTTRKGPIFANLILADEINRAPAKVQSALLEAMQERQVTIGAGDLPAAGALPRPRHPEPHRAGGHLPAARGAGRPLHAQAARRLPEPRGGAPDHGRHGGDRDGVLAEAGGPARRDPAGARRSSTRSTSTRRSRTTSSTSSSPRASRRSTSSSSRSSSATAPRRARASHLAVTAKAHAFLSGRGYVTPQDVKSMAPDVLRHRLIVSYEAEAEETDLRRPGQRGSSTSLPVPWRRDDPAGSPPEGPADRDPDQPPGDRRLRRASTTASSRARAWSSRRCASTSPATTSARIDWNVTARGGEPFVKKFTEERELTVMLLVDVSASQRFGSTARSRSDLAAEIAAVLAFAAIRNNDRVGLVLFTDAVELYVPPRKGTQPRAARDPRGALLPAPQPRHAPGGGAGVPRPRGAPPGGRLPDQRLPRRGLRARAAGDRAAARPGLGGHRRPARARVARRGAGRLDRRRDRGAPPRRHLQPAGQARPRRGVGAAATRGSSRPSRGAGATRSRSSPASRTSGSSSGSSRCGSAGSGDEGQPAAPRSSPSCWSAWRPLRRGRWRSRARPLPAAGQRAVAAAAPEDAPLRGPKGLARWPAPRRGWRGPAAAAGLLALAAAAAIVAARRLRGRRRGAASAPFPSPAARIAARDGARGPRRAAREGAGGDGGDGAVLPGAVRRSSGATSRSGSACARRSGRPRSSSARRRTPGLLAPAHQERLQAFLEQCDLVKFARHRPAPGDAAAALEAAERLVRETRPRERGQPRGRQAADELPVPLAPAAAPARAGPRVPARVAPPQALARLQRRRGPRAPPGHPRGAGAPAPPPALRRRRRPAGGRARPPAHRRRGEPRARRRPGHRPRSSTSPPRCARRTSRPPAGPATGWARPRRSSRSSSSAAPATASAWSPSRPCPTRSRR